MKTLPAIILLLLCAILQAEEVRKPNVLFIAIDDMNDGITLFGENRPFKTPHICDLARRGVFSAGRIVLRPPVTPPVPPFSAAGVPTIQGFTVIALTGVLLQEEC